MLKIWNYEHLNLIKKNYRYIFWYIKNLIKILDENYGENRNVDKDLGGYVLVVESVEDVKELKNEMLKDILPEYTDEIICSEGVNYTSSLFLLSDDFSVVVIANEELSKLLLD